MTALQTKQILQAASTLPAADARRVVEALQIETATAEDFLATAAALSELAMLKAAIEAFKNEE